MSQRTKIYNRFDVVVVPFPFTDSNITKRRPALVISQASVFNAPMAMSVMAMITTATYKSWAECFKSCICGAKQSVNCSDEVIHIGQCANCETDWSFGAGG